MPVDLRGTKRENRTTQ